MSGNYLAAVEGTIVVVAAAAVTAANIGSRGRGGAEEGIPSDLPICCTRDDLSVVRMGKKARTKDVGLHKEKGLK
jgi:hypothetical protein